LPEKRFVPIELQVKTEFKLSHCINKTGPFMRQVSKDYFNNGLARDV
jgi:hypothetical protein